MKLLASFLAVVCAAFAAPALAQNFPDRPIRFVVPFPPGRRQRHPGARARAEAWPRSLGQPVVIDNRPGAGGNIGTELVAKAPADGYTHRDRLEPGDDESLALRSKLPFDIEKDFAPVALVASVPIVLVVNPAVPAQNVQRVHRARQGQPAASSTTARPATARRSTSRSRCSTTPPASKVTHVPYKGTGPAIADLHRRPGAGRRSAPWPRSSRTSRRASCARSRWRRPSARRRCPSVPTVAEAGLPGFDVSLWYSILAPAGTPRPIVARLSSEVEKALNAPDNRAAPGAAGLRGELSQSGRDDAAHEARPGALGEVAQGHRPEAGLMRLD